MRHHLHTQNYVHMVLLKMKIENRDNKQTSLTYAKQGSNLENTK